MIVVCDIEADALVNPSKIWCIVCEPLDSTERRIWKYPDFEGFTEYASTVDKWVMHNGINYDARQIRRLVDGTFDHFRVVDSLILSRLVDYRLDGHSLEAWGTRLGYAKDLFDDFSKLTDELVNRCIRDVEINKKLFNQVFRKYYESEEWRPSIDLELTCACLSEEMSDNGFPFDIETAEKLHSEFSFKLGILDKEIIDAFPPKPVLVREITPVGTKHGTIHKKDFRWAVSRDGTIDLSPFSIGAPFSLIEFKEFNPGSTVQIVERMNAAGWEPVEKTKTHIATERELKMCKSRIKRAALQEKLSRLTITGWKVSEKNLETLPEDAPEPAKKLSERLILARRVSVLEEWINAYDKETGSLHPTINTLGCWTHRANHTNPNSANIVSTDKPYGYQLRNLWRITGQGLDRRLCDIRDGSGQCESLGGSDPGVLLVDVDAEGIQLRVLAHYMDDEQFINALVNGNEEDQTDVHNLNKRALGPVCVTRKAAKNFIFSWLLGAGVGMTASILKCTAGDAKVARSSFEGFYPGLKSLKSIKVPQDAARGYFVGFDGRKVKCDSEHHMLSGYLQNGEAVVMKTAWVLADEQIRAEKLPAKFINFVHDEFVFLTRDGVEVARRTRDIACDAIAEAGNVLKLKCPMAGKGSWGLSWAEIH